MSKLTDFIERVTEDVNRPEGTVVDEKVNEQHNVSYTALGQKVAALFGLKKNSDGRYKTNWGTKTDIGIGASIMRLVDEAGLNMPVKDIPGEGTKEEVPAPEEKKEEVPPAPAPKEEKKEVPPVEEKKIEEGKTVSVQEAKFMMMDKGTYKPTNEELQGYSADYAGIAKDFGLGGPKDLLFTRYMQQRWPKGQDVAYAKEWAKRFRDAAEWDRSDSEGREVLKKLAPNSYVEQEAVK